MAKRDFKFKKVFMLTDLALWINGSHPALPRDGKWALKSFATLSISLALIFLLSNSIITYRVPNGDYKDVVREATINILAFTLIAKYTIIVYNRKIVYKLIDSINDDFDTATKFSKKEIGIVLKFIERALKATKLWIYMAGTSGVVFAGKGILSTIYYHCTGTDKYVQIFDIMLPSKYNHYKEGPLGYFIMCSMLIIFEVYAVFVYIGFEPLVSILLLHACGQLEILSLRMENIFVNAKTSNDIVESIKSINLKMQSIYKFTEDVQATFAPLFEFTMKSTTIGVPFILFEIVQRNNYCLFLCDTIDVFILPSISSFRQHEVNLEFICLLCCAILQFYLPCYYSDYLMAKSEDMRRAIYSCGWEKDPNRKVRKMVLFMLTRTTKPVVLYTFFYPLCLETFAEMCRQAYTIYNIMMAVYAQKSELFGY